MVWLIWATFAFYFACYVISRLTIGINKSSSCLVGKTAIITGANSGIGYQTALNLASRGCRVIMAVGTDTDVSKNNIIKYTNNPNIVKLQVNLASLKSIRQFADEILKIEQKLHILINNAGIGTSEEKTTEDGLNPVMQVNYFGPFLLTHLLIDLLKKSAPSRIVFTTSGMAFFNNLTLENLNWMDEKTVKSSFRLYSNSKLAEIIASDIFAEKLKGTGVTCNAVHPGFVDTPIYKKSFAVHYSGLFEPVIRLMSTKVYARSPWEGAQGVVRAAVSKKLEKTTGTLFVECVPYPKWFGFGKACQKDFCKSIWKASEEYVGLTPEEKL